MRSSITCTYIYGRLRHHHEKCYLEAAEAERECSEVGGKKPRNFSAMRNKEKVKV